MKKKNQPIQKKDSAQNTANTAYNRFNDHDQSLIVEKCQRESTQIFQVIFRSNNYMHEGLYESFFLNSLYFARWIK